MKLDKITQIIEKIGKKIRKLWRKYFAWERYWGRYGWKRENMTDYYWSGESPTHPRVWLNGCRKRWLK